MRKIRISIDESGTLPDPKDRVVIIAAVGIDNLALTDRVHKSIRKSLRKKSKAVNEIKFYLSGEKTKLAYLRDLASQNIGIFILIVEKNGQKIADTSENFAVLCWLLLEECFLFYKEREIKEIIFDRHFHREKDQEKFNKILNHLLRREFAFVHVDSKTNPFVNASDMIAGSVLWYCTGKSTQFYQLIKEKIISEKHINWKEAKRKFFTKNV